MNAQRRRSIRANSSAPSGSGFFYWLAYGKTFGIPTVTLNLSVIQLTFGFQISINIASIIGMCLAIFVHRKV